MSLLIRYGDGYTKCWLGSGGGLGVLMAFVVIAEDGISFLLGGVLVWAVIAGIVLLAMWLVASVLDYIFFG